MAKWGYITEQFSTGSGPRIIPESPNAVQNTAASSQAWLSCGWQPADGHAGKSVYIDERLAVGAVSLAMAFKPLGVQYNA
jgi:hypothetical protein